jgi:hypothetical protein
MSRLVIVLVSVAIGVAIGWYFGYTRPVTKQYRILRDTVKFSDEEMAKTGAELKGHLPEIIEGWKRGDEIETMMALGALKRLESGNTDEAKKLLLTSVRTYYREYHERGGNRDIIARIEEVAQQYPEIAAEIGKNSEAPH